MTVADGKVEQPGWQRHYLAPSCRTAAPGESEALEVLGHLLGGGQTEPSLSHAGDGGEARGLGLGLLPRHGARPKPVHRRHDPCAGRIAGDARQSLRPDAGEVLPRGRRRRRARARQDAARRRRHLRPDSQSDLARWYGWSLAIGQTIRDVEDWPEKIEAVSAEAVIEAARRWLDHKPAVTGLFSAAE